MANKNTNPEPMIIIDTSFICSECECEILLSCGQFEKGENSNMSIFCPVCQSWNNNVSASAIDALRAFEDNAIDERAEEDYVWQHTEEDEVNHPCHDFTKILRNKVICSECHTEYAMFFKQAPRVKGNLYSIKCPKCGKFCMHIPAIEEPVIEQL